MENMIAFFKTSSNLLRDFQVQHDSMVTTIHARFDATKKDQKTPAQRFVELRIERRPFKELQLRWRSGFLYNDRAIFRIVPPTQRSTWLEFADRAGRAVRYRASVEVVKADNLLQLLASQ